MAKFRYLQFAYTLAREGSFKGAALELHVSQPTLSKGIAALESEYGMQLFDRSTRPLQPTVAGRLVLAEAERCLQGQENLRQKLLEIKGLSSRQIRIAWGPYAYGCFADRFAHAYQRECPGVELTYRPTSWLDAPGMLTRGEVDLAVADVSTLSPRDYDITPLRSTPIRLVCGPSHPLAKLASVSLDDVFEFKLAICNIPLWARPWLRSNMPDVDPRDTPACLVTDDYRLIQDLIVSGDYCTLIAAEAYSTEIRNGRLIARELPNAPATQAGIILPVSSPASGELAGAVRVLNELDRDTGPVECT